MSSTNLFQPVKGNNLSEKVAIQIEASILSGKIQPGNRLSSERDLQTQFEVGRGAIREALQTLKQKGIIEIRKGVKGGAYAKKIEIGSASESLSLLLKQNMVPIEHLVEFRDAIDQTEVILASLRGDKEEKEELVDLAMTLSQLSALSDEPDIDEIKTIDRKMNLLLAKMTKNSVFEWIKSTIQLSIGSYDSLLYEDSKYRDKTIDNWINTAKEIAAGEPLKALSLCSYHYVLLQSCLKDKQLGETRADDVKEKKMLKLSNVTKRFGALVAVNDLSFEVNKGQVFGIAGPNGAGKSTVYNLITGFYPFEGSILFDGKEISGLKPHQIARLGISRTFQIPQTFPSLTVEQSLEVGNRFGNRARHDIKRIEKIMDFVELQSERTALTGTLNLLGKKKLMIGAALATDPEILMLDEPMAGSNAHEIKALMELIKRINEELGVTIIIIEHFMKVLTELTQTLLIIETGTEICCGDPVDVTNDPKVIECYLGGDDD